LLLINILRKFDVYSVLLVGEQDCLFSYCDMLSII